MADPGDNCYISLYCACGAYDCKESMSVQPGLCLACIVPAALIVANAASAQNATDSRPAESSTVEEIVVTGSRISRRDFFSLSPIVSVDRKEITLTGTLRTNDLLNSLPQVDPGLGAGTGNTFEGTARVNLRGLGDTRTLTLLNGRRFADGTVFGAADLNALPPVMIKRVEVITGGASAVYGSDAVAGAVNFILRDDFDGLEGTAHYGITERGDGDTFNADLAFGTAFADGKGHVSAFLSYLDRSSVFQDARSFSRDQLFANNQTGEIENAESIFSGAGTIEGVPGVSRYTFDPNGQPRLLVEPDDLYNTASENALIAPMTRTSVGLFGQLDISSNLAASLELMYTGSKPTQRRSDVFVDFVSVNTDRPDISPALQSLLATDYDPDGDGIADFLFGRRFAADLGTAVNPNERDFFRVMFGLGGNLGQTWSWTADYSYSNTDWKTRATNDASRSRIQQGLLVDPATGSCFDPGNGCVPVDLFGAGNLSAAAAQFIRLGNSGYDESAKEQILNVTVNGSPVRTWAGPVDVAIGAEYREVDVSHKPTEAVLNGDSMFFGTDFVKGVDHTITEAYFEALGPLAVGTAWADYLRLELGGRFSDYDAIDDNIYTWKAGIE